MPNFPKQKNNFKQNFSLSNCSTYNHFQLQKKYFFQILVKDKRKIKFSTPLYSLEILSTVSKVLLF